MNRMSRNVLAAALSAVVALGAAPAAVAGPHGHGHGHGKGDKVAAKAVKDERHARAGQGRTYGLAKRADRKADYLDRLALSNKVTGLGDLALPVMLNISADSDELRDLAEALRQGSFDTTDLSDLRAIRPEVYHRIINQVRLVTELIAELETTPAEDPGAVVTDPTAPPADAPATATATATLADASGQLAALQALLVELQAYDARTSRAELKSAQTVIEAAQEALGVPLIGNVFLLTATVARFFRKRTIPGVVISDALFDVCEKRAADADKGAAFFRELAAKQLAIFRGLGFAGGYLGGVHRIEDVEAILDIERSFAPDDWKQFARDIQYPVENEFYYYARNEQTGLADPEHLEPAYEASLQRRRPTKNVTLNYRLSKFIHDAVFTPGTKLNRLGQWVYKSSRDTFQGPRSLRVLEHAGKAAMFACKDCGDCSLPDIAFLCPESQCAKNQRNGPCGGTRDGKCEVHDFECIWGRAYDRMKYEGDEQQMLDHTPVIQDESLRGTSSWANALLCRDHTSRCPSGTSANQIQPPETKSDVHASPDRPAEPVVETATENQNAAPLQADRRVDQQLVRTGGAGVEEP